MPFYRFFFLGEGPPTKIDKKDKNMGYPLILIWRTHYTSRPWPLKANQFLTWRNRLGGGVPDGETTESKRDTPMLNETNICGCSFLMLVSLPFSFAFLKKNARHRSPRAGTPPPRQRRSASSRSGRFAAAVSDCCWFVVDSVAVCCVCFAMRNSCLQMGTSEGEGWTNEIGGPPHPPVKTRGCWAVATHLV